MKIQINQIEIHNFKGITNLIVRFSNNTLIEGPNHSGKTTIADAFFWCLFGKDSKGKQPADFNIRPLDNEGNEIPDLTPEVSVQLSVDGQSHDYHCAYTRDKKGGNNIEYSIDNVPLKKSEYFDKIREIILEDKFRMLTDVLNFAQMDWRKQRQMLSEMAGDVKISETGLLDDPIFNDLITFLSENHTVDEYDKYVKAQKKVVNERLNKIPSEIKGKEETIQEVDEAKINAEISRINTEKDELIKQRNEITAKIESAAQRVKAFNVDRDNLTEEISKFNAQILKIKEDAGKQAFEEYHKAMSKYYDYCQQKLTAESSSSNLNHQIEILQRQIQADQDYIGKEDSSTGLRKQWVDLNAQQWNGDRYCPTCHQELPSEKIEEAMEAFNVNKATNLQAIVDEINSRKNRIAANNETIAKLQKQIEEITIPEPMQEPVRPAEPDMTTNKEYLAAVQLKTELQNKLNNMVYTDSANAYTAERTQVQAKISELEHQLCEQSELKGQLSVNLVTQKQISKLQDELATCNTELAKWEQNEEAIKRYRKLEVDLIEDKISSLFRRIRFRFFRQQVNGEYEPCCECTMHGTPYANLSASEKVNAGIDIINALSIYLNVNAPIFIDNAEGVTDFEPTDSQIIRLSVKDADRINVTNNLF